MKVLDGAVERDDEYVVWRTKETEFMKAFALTLVSCRWQLLPKILGQEDAKACVTRCTFCDPRGALQHSLDPMAAESRIYKKLTPGGRSVYAQKRNSSQIAPNPHLWKRIIEKCIDMVANGTIFMTPSTHLSFQGHLLYSWRTRRESASCTSTW